jgi:hypothetical protein
MNKKFYVRDLSKKSFLIAFLISQNLMGAEQKANKAEILRDHPLCELSMFDPDIKPKQLPPYYALFIKSKYETNFRVCQVYNRELTKIKLDKENKNLLCVKFIDGESELLEIR